GGTGAGGRQCRRGAAALRGRAHPPHPPGPPPIPVRNRVRRTRHPRPSNQAHRQTGNPVVKPVGEPDAGNPHVRFDERGRETERLPKAQATAPFLDSTPHRYPRLPTSANMAPCGSLAWTIQLPPGTSIGRLAISPPPAFSHS